MSALETVVIVNPGSGGADAFVDVQRQVSGWPRTTVRETKSAEDARRFAREAADGNDTRIIAAGGDGTVHQVVNGIMSAPPAARRRATLGIIPLGTGNDLPRTLGIPLDPFEAVEVIQSGKVQLIDLMKVRQGERTLFGCNVAAGGFTGQLNEAMTDEVKATWGPLAYLRGAVGLLPNLQRYVTTLRHNGSTTTRIHALNVIVANGRTAGGGIVVAPTADPQDGLLDVVIVHAGTTLELTGVAARLLAGDYTNSDIVTHRRVRRVAIDSTPGMWFNVDGEMVTNEPITMSIVPHALNVISGPDFTPESAPNHPH